MIPNKVFVVLNVIAVPVTDTTCRVLELSNR